MPTDLPCHYDGYEQKKTESLRRLRTNNWSILEQRKLINGDRVRECKQKMNTFGFTGALESSPQITCIYQNDSAQNLFLNQPGGTAAPPAAGSEQF